MMRGSHDASLHQVGALCPGHASGNGAETVNESPRNPSLQTASTHEVVGEDPEDGEQDRGGRRDGGDEALGGLPDDACDAG